MDLEDLGESLGESRSLEMFLIAVENHVIDLGVFAV